MSQYNILSQLLAQAYHTNHKWKKRKKSPKKNRNKESAAAAGPEEKEETLAEWLADILEIEILDKKKKKRVEYYVKVTGPGFRMSRWFTPEQLEGYENLIEEYNRE